MRHIRIATRGSLLAMSQSRQVAEAIAARWDDVAVELVSIATRGDRQRGPLAPVGGKGLFTAELERALLQRRVHLAVHSAKDMPAAMDGAFAIAAVPTRADPRDAVVSGHGPLGELPVGATVGTGSLRRRVQLLAIRGDLKVVPVRGNVETRLRKALGDEAEMDATVLAMAGLVRSGLAERFGGCIHPLDAEEFVPAAGQAALALQALADDAETAALLAPLDDRPSHEALAAEREVLRALGAGCQSCIAVHVAARPGCWRGWAMVARPDGGEMVRLTLDAATAGEAGAALLAGLRDRGAERILADAPAR